uniref:Uncharacterized protein n=1 Tax=Oryza brachyantha TaxID=4533 RepID=J3LC02_ORYBR
FYVVIESPNKHIYVCLYLLKTGWIITYGLTLEECSDGLNSSETCTKMHSSLMIKNVK